MKRKKQENSDSALRYIKKKPKVGVIIVRVDPKLKERIEKASRKLKITGNKFSQAALMCYLEVLEKEGSL